MPKRKISSDVEKTNKSSRIEDKEDKEHNDCKDHDHDVNTPVIVRPWNGEATLIIGCGNGPSPKASCPCCPPVGPEYTEEHKHEGEYTIDINPDMNPSAILDITRFRLPIPSNSISKVVFEGISLYYQHCELVISEIRRVSTEGAEIDVSVIPIGSYRDAQSGDWRNCYMHNMYLNWRQLQNYDPEGKSEVEKTCCGFVIEYCNICRMMKDGRVKLVKDIQELNMDSLHRFMSRSRHPEKYLLNFYGKLENGTYFSLYDRPVLLTDMFQPESA